MPDEFTILQPIYWVLFGFAGVVILPLALWKFTKDLKAQKQGDLEEVQADEEKIPLRHINFVDALVLLFAFALYYRTGSGSSDIEVSDLLMGLVSQAIVIGLVVLVWVFRVNMVEALGLNRMRPNLLKWSFGIVVATWVFGLVLMGAGYESFLESVYGKAPLQGIVQFLKSTDDALALTLLALVACIGAPVAEEVLFRGYIYPVTKTFTGAPVAMVFSGLLFATIHYNLLSLPVLFVMGILLALAYEKTRSLWVPIIGHAVFNSITVGFQLLSRVVDLPVPQS